MSLEFNRRSFLKYSAAAAVAVAGSSLLVGCGEDEYQKTGKIGSTLKLMGTFKTYKSTDAPTKAPAYTGTTFTCTVNIKCTTKKVPLYVTNECFELTVTRGKNEKNYAKQYITITDPEFDLKERCKGLQAHHHPCRYSGWRQGRAEVLAPHSGQQRQQRLHPCFLHLEDDCQEG